MSRGFVLWFTGLSGSGKSTLTSMVAAELRRRGVHVETLDGDEIRKHLSRGLGFSRDDRDENIRRIGFVAKLIGRGGSCAIAAAISPYREVRDEVHRSIENFVEVYTECPVAVLAERDPKGLYKKALAGEIQNFTGVNDPYEAPTAADVHLHTDTETPGESLAKILACLEARGLIPVWGRVTANAEASRTREPRLIAPHGQELVEGMLLGEAATSAREAARALPTVDLDAAGVRDVLALGRGAYSPLRGFMTSKDYRRVVREMRLESGLPWALPVTLAVPGERETELRQAAAALLRGPDGAPVGTMSIEELWRPDLALQAESDLAGTTGSEQDPPHGGQPPLLVAGTVRCFERDARAELERWRSPREVRASMAERGWSSVTALHTGDLPFAPEEYLLRAALELVDGVLVQPTASPSDSVSLGVRAECYEALLSGYFARDSWIVAPYARPAGVPAQRAMVHDAIVAKNFGASRLVLLDGTGNTVANVAWAQGYYGPAELGIDLVLPEPVVLSSRTGGLATTHSAPDAGSPVDRGSVTDAIRGGVAVDPRLVRPEVAAILRRALGERR